jgi:hypothetical protein
VVGVDRNADRIDAADEARVHTGAVEVGAPDVARVKARPVDKGFRARGKGEGERKNEQGEEGEARTAFDPFLPGTWFLEKGSPRGRCLLASTVTALVAVQSGNPESRGLDRNLRPSEYGSVPSRSIQHFISRRSPRACLSDSPILK